MERHPHPPPDGPPHHPPGRTLTAAPSTGPAGNGSLEREAAFFDAQVADLDVESLPPREYAPIVSQFEDSIIDAAGELAGARVLDLGCGIGDLSLRLLDRGAEVTGLDVAAGALEIARQRAARFRPGAPARFVEAPVERTGLPDAAFDVVVGKWVLHHLDLGRSLPEIRRVMKPGAVGVFSETSALNPLLRVARRRLVGRAGIPRFGTPDEHPIDRADLRRIGQAFSECSVDHPDFLLFHLLDRHLVRGRSPRLSRLLRTLDRRAQRHTRALGRASYYMRITVRA